MNQTQVRHFRRILRRFERVTSTQLRDCCAEVTLAQCLVLMEVDEANRLTVGQLAARLRLDNSTLSRTIDGLVRKGLLERVRDDQDRRVVWIGLTRAGRGGCRTIHDEHDALYRAVFDRIPTAMRQDVVHHFEVLVDAFLDHEAAAHASACCEAIAAESSDSEHQKGA